MEKKMEERLASLDSFVLDAVKVAGLDDRTVAISKRSSVIIETGTELACTYDVWGLGERGNARIAYAVDKDDWKEIHVVVSDYGGRTNLPCYTFKEVVNALKKLVTNAPAPVINVPF